MVVFCVEKEDSIKFVEKHAYLGALRKVAAWFPLVAVNVSRLEVFLNLVCCLVTGTSTYFVNIMMSIV